MMINSSIPLLLWLLVIAAMDFNFRKVRNLFCFFGFLFFFAYAPYELNFFKRIFFSVLIFFLFLFFYYKRLMGAGDVKFIFVLSLLVGLNKDFLMIFSIGSITSLMHGFLIKSNFNLIKFSPGFFQGYEFKRNIPYAGHLAIATICWMLLKNSSIDL